MVNWDIKNNAPLGVDSMVTANAYIVNTSITSLARCIIQTTFLDTGQTGTEQGAGFPSYDPIRVA